MEAILTSLITQLKNPWQYICVGVVWGSVVYFDINREYLVPALICSLGIAYIIQTIFNKISYWFKIKKKNNSILFNLLHMNNDEKEFVGYCFSNHIQTYSVNVLYQNSTIWNTLPQKGIALRPSGFAKYDSLSLSIPENVWKLIEKHQNEIFAEYIIDADKE